jgi:hypothetical protein
MLKNLKMLKIVKKKIDTYIENAIIVEKYGNPLKCRKKLKRQIEIYWKR